MRNIIATTYNEFFWVKKCINSCYDNPTPKSIEICKQLLSLFSDRNDSRFEKIMRTTWWSIRKTYKYSNLAKTCEQELYIHINNLIKQYNVNYNIKQDNLNKKIKGYCEYN